MKLSSYAPGDGALSFVYQSRRRNREGGYDLVAGDEPETMSEIPSKSVPNGWAAVMVRGCIRGVKVVERIDHDLLWIDRDAILYGPDETGSVQFLYADDRTIVRHLATVSALQFFLANEDEIRAQTLDFSI